MLENFTNTFKRVKKTLQTPLKDVKTLQTSLKDLKRRYHVAFLQDDVGIADQRREVADAVVDSDAARESNT